MDINWKIETGPVIIENDDELTTNEQIALLIREQTYDERMGMAHWFSGYFDEDVQNFADALGSWADEVLE